MHERLMRLALEEAAQALAEGEVPVGAVIARGDEVIARAHNRREQLQDPTAHAEVLVIREAARRTGSRRLSGLTLYVTLEPCPMCAGAMVLSGLGRCYYAAPDAKQGCGGSVYALTDDPAFSHRLPCVGGVMQAQAEALLKRFFETRRAKGEP